MVRRGSPEGLDQVLANPESCFTRRELFIKNSRVITLTRYQTVSAKPFSLIVRRLNYGKPLHRLRDFLRSSRARRAFQMAFALERFGIATPKAFATAEQRLLRWPVTAYLVTEAISDARTVAELLTEEKPKLSLVYDLASLIARLHNTGFSHRDLKLANILIDGQFKPYLIDLDGVRFHGKITLERTIRDLSRLWLGMQTFPGRTAIGWRFLQCYCATRGMKCDVKQFSTRIVEIGNTMHAKLVRKEQP